ncbi:unnamed protein product [Allacma fusca]|uniref:procollagen-proline 4-dioxygenase n=1 Tax=Allacma fusca TaxID=39272 RepID=A0A8J2LFV4_9HEXA|nr:unnamed protein product [Allacma fusca]
MEKVSPTFETILGENPSATILIHLEDIKQEGNIVFPYAKVASQPVSGSALFWFNQFSDGGVDDVTKHGICPLSFGEKWVAKKLILPKDSFLGRHCTLRKNERHQFPVNGKYFQKRPEDAHKSVRKSREGPTFPKGKKYHKYSVISLNGMTDLVQLEWRLYPRLKEIYHTNLDATRGTFRDELETKNRDVLMYFQNFEESTKKLVEKLEDLPHNDVKAAKKVSLNPVAVYKLLSRFHLYYFPWILDSPHVGNNIKLQIVSLVNRFYSITDGPSEVDYEDAMFIILKIQFVYDLDVKDVAAGLIDGVDSRISLNALDCFLIGKLGTSKKFFTSGIEWLEHSLYLTENTSDNSVRIEEVYDELANAEMLHDKELPQEKFPKYHFFHNPLSEIRNRDQRITGKSMMYQELEANITESKNYDNMLWGVCRGKIQQTNEQKSKLFCWYEKEIHSSYKIGPIKAEFLSIRPYPDIVQFYDVLSDRAMEDLRNYGQENSFRIVMSNGEFDPLKSAIIGSEDKKLAYLESARTVGSMNRLSKLKALKPSSRLPFYYYAYPPGTARGRHYDGEIPNVDKYVASFIFYISDVEKGGETVFHRIGLKVTPRKGSGIYFYNFHSSGKINPRMEHASCPIVFGEKWIVARDFFESEQHHLQCHLKPEGIYEIIVNGQSRSRYQ